MKPNKTASTCKQLFLVSLFALLLPFAYAQPVNDACANAINLPCGTTNLAGTTVGAVSETSPGVCVGNYGVWYSFTGNGVSNTISATSPMDIGMRILSGSCGALTGVTCQDGPAAGGTETYTFTPANGVTYYVYIAYWSTGSTTNTFTITRTCAIPPSNDACTNATPLPCGTSSLVGTTVNAVSETVPGCTIVNGYGVWYSFVGNGQNTSLTVVSSGFDPGLAVFSGTCASKTQLYCEDNTGTGGTEVVDFFANNGTTYFLYVGNYSGSTGGTFTISRTCIAPPSNDACANATPLPCGTSSLAGTTVGAVSETAPPNCGSEINNYGVWYSFVGDGNNTTITVQETGGFDTGVGIYSGSCGSLTNLYCLDGFLSSDPEIQSFNTVNGTTYFIYVSYFDNTANVQGTFTISRTCTTPPTNDACANATPLPCGTSSLAGTTVGAVSEALPPTCGGYVSNYGVWYTFVGDGNNTTITVQGTGGFDTGVGIYSGTCSSLTKLFCLDAVGATNPEIQSFSTLSGVTYYVYVSYFDDLSSATGTFTISKTCSPASTCTIGSNNDYCTSPATLTPGSGTFSASTYDVYTADESQIDSDNNGLFCGSIENNSWYTFTATSSTASFPISYVGACDYGDGIQGQVFDIGYNINGCCATFTSMSNCYNPAIATTGTITATGLQVGHDYVLMIDGYAGDGCAFTIDNWSAIGILPIELLSISASDEEEGNLVQWSTASELNNAFFRIHHSRDGKIFQAIDSIPGGGNTNQKLDYQYLHELLTEGMHYYKVEQVDLDGKSSFSQIVSTSRGMVDGLIKVAPNPANDLIAIYYQSDETKSLDIIIYDGAGNRVYEANRSIQKGSNAIPISIEHFQSGYYFMKTISNQKVNQIKFIKN